MSKKTVYKEGKWRCTHIDLSGEDICNYENPGPALKCEKCGKHRPKNVQFYLLKDAKVVTSQDQLFDAKAGANWQCMFCNYHNKATSHTCVHCEKPRDKDYEEWINLGGTLDQKSYDSNQTPNHQAPQQSIEKEYVPVRSRIKKYGKLAGIAIIGVALIALIYNLFFATTDIQVEVSGFEWKRSIEIEASKMVTEEGWDVPHGGKQTKRVKKQSGTKEVYDHSEWDEEPIYESVQVGTRQVECGTIDKGNGYFETQYCDEPIYEDQQVGTREVERKIYREEAVYDYWYTYKIKRWQYSRTVESAGENPTANWPEYQLKKDERTSTKAEQYYIYLTPLSESEFGELIYEVDAQQWKSFKLGAIYTAKVTKNGKVKQLSH